MTDYPPTTLRLEPHAIPAIRAAFDAALDELGPELRDLANVGYISGPWLGDPASIETVEFYNRRVMDAPDGPYHALVTYQAELTRVRDQLVELEAAYQRTEGENAELWGRL